MPPLLRWLSMLPLHLLPLLRRPSLTGCETHMCCRYVRYVPLTEPGETW